MIRARAAAAGLAAATMGLAACSGSSSAGSTPPSSAPSSSAAGACAPVPVSPQPAGHFKAPPMTIKPQTYTATITTNCGTIVVALDGKAAPKTVNSFAFLAGKHFFDNTPCHRLTTDFIYVLQCGDPTGTGRGGPGYTLPDENLGIIKNQTYPAGTVAMANAGANTGGSQFFFVYRDSTGMTPSYTPFGTIVSGMDVLQRIAAQGTSTGGADGPPAQSVVIKSFTVTAGAPPKN